LLESYAEYEVENPRFSTQESHQNRSKPDMRINHHAKTTSFAGEGGASLSLSFDSRGGDHCAEISLRVSDDLRAIEATLSRDEVTSIANLIETLYPATPMRGSKSGSLRFADEDGGALYVRYDNRGEPYRDGVSVSLEVGDNDANVFLESFTARSLRKTIVDVYGPPANELLDDAPSRRSNYPTIRI